MRMWRSDTMLIVTGRVLVVAILGFLVLPAAVVAIAAFNDRALLSFPPQSWSLRWFVKAFSYRDFQAGFYNGLIVMLTSSGIALVVGTDRKSTRLNSSHHIISYAVFCL